MEEVAFLDFGGGVGGGCDGVVAFVLTCIAVGAISVGVDVATEVVGRGVGGGGCGGGTESSAITILGVVTRGAGSCCCVGFCLTKTSVPDAVNRV